MTLIFIWKKPQTSNLGVRGSNPFRRANNFKYLRTEQKALGSVWAQPFEAENIFSVHRLATV